MARIVYLVAVVLLVTSAAWAQPVGNKVQIRVVDVGAGLCCVAKTSDGHYFVYDAGNFVDRGLSAMTAIEEIIPTGATIDLLVLSHSDADHLAAVPFICETYKVQEVWREGLERDSQIWSRADQAIRREALEEGCRDRNLQDEAIEPGFALALGEAKVTFLCGFAEIPEEWNLSEGEDRNARSIVVRLDYGQSSILFAGDSVGRHINDPANVCLAAERVLVDNVASVPLDVDVVVAPHHGADNGSSTAFIRETSPRFVIFSSGSSFHHPHRRTAGRYLSGGVSAENIFRTDRGDNEGAPEWRPRSGASPDPIGDDHIEISLARNGQISVRYAATIHSFLSPRTFSVPHAGIAPDGTIGEPLSPRIRKWIENDSLWTERHEHLEDHTLDFSDSERSGEMPVLAAPVCERRRLLGALFTRRRCTR